MGAIDYLKGTCPSCGQEFLVQTKLGQGLMNEYEVGDEFPIPSAFGPAANLGLKQPCNHCNKDVIAVLRDDRITKFQSDAADVWEGMWGALYQTKEQREQAALEFQIQLTEEAKKKL